MPKLLVHLQNSGGAWHGGDLDLDMARVGIALYGLQPSLTDRVDGLQPVARVSAPVLAIHLRPAGTGVGYGHTHKTTRDSRLGIVPVGYGDGYPRRMSGRGVVQVLGQEVPVVGRVSMDQIVVDLTDVPAAGVGTEVTVVSNRSADPNSLDAMAATLETIPYELATGLGQRLERVPVA
jgi:alanine racemase